MAADRSEIIDNSDGLYMPVEQYLALDEATDGKYEYLNGYAYMLRPPSSYYTSGGAVDLAGGSPAHALIAMNIGYLLANTLRQGPCKVYSSDAKVKLAEKHYLYPDITVACDEQDDARYITNPTLIIEVLSPSTEKRDRSAKFKAYKALSSLQEYVLIGSQYKAIEVYRREGAFWKQSIYHAGDTVELVSLDVRFPFEEVYHHVRFAE